MAVMVDKMTQGEVPEHRVARIYCVPPPPNHAELAERWRINMVWHGFGMTEIYPLPMPVR
jgi:carnitine-CoA ligase